MKRLAVHLRPGSAVEDSFAEEDHEEDRSVATSDDPASLVKILAGDPDHVLLGDDDHPDGRFGTRGLAQRLERVLRKVNPPFTVSISGSWGVGKTTLARQVQALLEGPKVAEPDRIPVVYVDLWTEDTSDLRRQLALEVALRLGGADPSDQKKREEAARKFDHDLRTTQVRQERPSLKIPKGRRLAGTLLFLLALGAAIFAIASITVPTTDGAPDPIGLRAVLAIVGPVVVWLLVSSGVVFSVSTASNSTPPLEEKVALHQTFQSLVRSAGRPVVIIIDNLDRLPGDDAVKVLGEIRSFVEVKGSSCVFVVPLDRDALVRHLVGQMNGEKQAARDYLDKFFNLDVLLTKPVREDLRTWTRDDLLAPLFPSAPAQVVSLVAEIVTSAADGSPRAAKRIANGIYARAYLLPKGARDLTLPHLAFVEALVARFPGALGALIGDPRKWLETAAAFNNEGDENTRTRQLRPLLGLPEVSDPDSGEAADIPELLKSLRQLLILTPELPTEAEVRTILTARLDRRWANVPSTTEIRSALEEGDADRLHSVVAVMGPEDRGRALRAALDALRDDVSNKWQQGAIVKINALAAAVAGETNETLDLGRMADDILGGGTDLSLVPQLGPAAITLLFGDGPGRLGRRKQVLAAMLRDLTAAGGPASRGTAWGDIIAVVSTSDDPSQVPAFIAQLSKINDEDLAPVFDRPASPNVVAALGPRYADQIALWDTSTVLQTTNVAQRAARAKENGWKPEADALDKIATATTTFFPGLPSDALGAVENVVTLFDGVEPTTATTALAQALGGWPVEPVRSFELMLDVPATPTAVATVVASRLAGSTSLEDFAALARSQEKMRAVDVSFAEAAAKRWAAKEGPGYALLAVSSGNADDTAAFSRALNGVADQPTYIELLNGLAPLVEPVRYSGVAELLVDDLAARVSLIGIERLPLVAASTAHLSRAADVAVIIGAIESLARTTTRDEVPSLVAAIRAFVDAGVPGADALARVAGEQAATVGVALPADAEWLVDHGADKDHVRSALLGAIRTLPASAVLNFTPHLRRVAKVNAFGMELVTRAAGEPPGARRPWLEEAAFWPVPGNKAQRKAYDDYLDQALVDDSDAADTVRELRAKLGGR